MKALVAEVIVGELARALGLLVPELVAIELEAALGAAEPDPEIQELIVASVGVNLGVDFLPGALAYVPGAGFTPEPAVAADVVWLDALTTNVDRTPRNPNLLLWHGRLWLIDHGAALYLHHQGLDAGAGCRAGVPAHRRARAAARAGSITEAHARLAPRVDRELLRRIAALVPDDWLGDDRSAEVYVDYLARRVQDGAFAEEAERARRRRVARSPTRSCASSRGSSAASASTSASSCSAASATSSASASLLDPARLHALAPGVDAAQLEAHLQGLCHAATGDPRAGAIAALPASERFGWLVAPSSTMIQPSEVHTGLCEDPQATLDALFAELVSPVDAPASPP